MKQKVNLSSVHPSKVFYGYLYPIFARPFLFGSNYEEFAEMVSKEFVLTSNQWDCILWEWEIKEKILTSKEPAIN